MLGVRIPPGLNNSVREILMKRFFRYLKECRLEMKKVAWPTRSTILTYTKIVLVTSLIFAALLGLVDFVLLKGIYLVF